MGHDDNAWKGLDLPIEARQRRDLAHWRDIFRRRPACPECGWPFDHALAACKENVVFTMGLSVSVREPD